MRDNGASPMVFTRGGGNPLADKQLRQLLQQHEIAAVLHGFRSSFRDWAAEEVDQQVLKRRRGDPGERELLRTRAKLGEMTMRMELAAELLDKRGVGQELRKLLRRGSE